MVKFRRPRKKRGSRSYSTISPMIDKSWDNKRTLSSLGRQRLRELRARKAVRDKAKAKHQRQSFEKWLRKKPIKMKTSDRSKAIILRQGFANLYSGQPEVKPRALVLVFVDGKLLPFYKSSGESSKRPGEWYPAEPEILAWKPGEKATAGMLLKFAGHRHRGNPPTFPKWAMEISTRIAREESKIQFQKKWDAETYRVILKELFGRIYFSDKLEIHSSRT